MVSFSERRGRHFHQLIYHQQLVVLLRLSGKPYQRALQVCLRIFWVYFSRLEYSDCGFGSESHAFFLMVSSLENVNSASLIQCAFQFLNVEMHFFMLAEGRTLGISFLFCLESLCGVSVRARYAERG